MTGWPLKALGGVLTHRWIDLCALFIFDVGRAPLTFGLTGRRRNRTGVADILRVLPVGFILIALFAKVACLTGLEIFRSEEPTLNSSHSCESRMQSST